MALDLLPQTHEGAPLPSATVMLLRDGAAGVEVLLMRRHAESRELGGAYVFPGGKLDPQDVETASGLLDRAPEALLAELGEPGLDTATASGLYLAALRETIEECGVLPGVVLPQDSVQMLREHLKQGGAMGTGLDRLGLRAPTASLLPWSRWITPKVAALTRRRFDARFFVARAMEGQEAVHDAHEATEVVWLRPREALERYWAREIDLAPPQIMTLAHFAAFATVDALIEMGRRRLPPLVLPQIIQAGPARCMAYPGDPAHEIGERAWPGPTRLMVCEGRFEPEGGFEGFFSPA